MFYSFIFISRVTSRFSCRYTWWVLYISFSWDFRACPSRPAALLAHVQGTTSLILYVNRAGFFWAIELIRKCRLSPSVWSVFLTAFKFNFEWFLNERNGIMCSTHSCVAECSSKVRPLITDVVSELAFEPSTMELESRTGLLYLNVSSWVAGTYVWMILGIQQNN